MKCVTFPLDPRFPGTTLTCYVHDISTACPHAPRRAMLVLPGGGYGICYDGEAEPIALAYVNAGLNAYVLRYGCNENARFPRPLLEASLAVKYIRDAAAEDNTDPEKIFAIGFSAGAHLCGALATLWYREDVWKAAGIAEGENRIAGAILSYPVVTGGPYRHHGSFAALLGKDDPTKEELALYSNEKNVSRHTPPVFLWHTADDDCVPVQNTLLMAEALAAEKIPFEVHIYPHGWHGLCLATDETARGERDAIRPNIATWLPLSVTWLESI